MFSDHQNTPNTDHSQPLTSRVTNLMFDDPQNIKNYDSEDGILHFNMREFIKLLIYHILYMMVLGPFANFIIGPIEGMAFLKTTKFCTLDYTLATQIIPWASFVFAFYVWAFYDDEEQIITVNSISLASVVLLMRIITVAVRYATTPPSMMERIRKVDSREEMWNEYILIGWTMATPQLFEEQIRISMGRNQIENILFTFKSLKKLNNEQQRMLKDFSYIDTIYPETDFAKVAQQNEQVCLQLKEQGKFAWKIFVTLQKEKRTSLPDRQSKMSKSIPALPAKKSFDTLDEGSGVDLKLVRSNTLMPTRLTINRLQ